MQAVVAATVLAVLSLLVPPLSILSSAVIALVILRQGQVEGLLTTGLAGLASGLLVYLLLHSPAPAFGFILLWLPVFVLALVLRITRSISLTIEAALVLGVMAIGVVYLQVPEPAVAWREALEPFSQELTKAELIAEDQRTLFLGEMARWMTGFFAAVFFLLLVVSVFVARWWQAVLYNPGGFRQEFHALRLHRALGFAGLAVLGLRFAGFANEGPILDLGILLSAPLMLQGLAVAHGVSALTKAHAAWLVAMYILWFFAMPQVTMLLALVGLADVWFDFRARVKTPGDSLNN